MAFTMTVRIEEDQVRQVQVSFEQAVAYLKSHGFRYDAADKQWFGDRNAQMAKRLPGESLQTMLRRHGIEVVAGFNDERWLWELAPVQEG